MITWGCASKEASGSVMTEPLQEVAQKHNVSTAQVVLRWSLQQNVSVVVGTAARRKEGEGGAPKNTNGCFFFRQCEHIWRTHA